MAGRVGRPKGSGNASQTFKIMKAHQILKLSESKLISVLKGETGLKEKEVVNVALELYKRRVPIHQDKATGGNQLTVVKIIKNHLPAGRDNIVDVDKVESAADEIIKNIPTRKLASLKQEIIEEDEDGD